ncbi:MAG TPA: TadE family protein [Gaiellaceae bacterium]|jgi:Flp pilus assembly protein TadG|nr:TadE family protein [Gaiellaceae bacterium]
MTRRRRIGLHEEHGQAAVEFAFVAPVLIALLLAIVQAGVAFNHYLAVTDAARAAARTAITARLAGVTVSDIQQAAQSAAGGLDLTNRVAVADPTDPTFTHAGSTLTVTVTYPYSIGVLGWAISSGDLQSTMTDRLE